MKKLWIILIVLLILAAIVTVPFSVAHYDDGGTVIITSLSYAVVKWNREQLVWNDEGKAEMECFTDTDFYLFPNNFKSYEEFWEMKD